MSCATVRLRPLKRNRSELNLDEKIEALSKVINSMTDSKKSYFQAKLCNIILKKQKLAALSICSYHCETNKLLTELDVMIAENELHIEIELMKNSKMYKRTENRNLRLSRDHYARKRAFNSTPKEAYTSTSVNTTQSIEDTPHVCRQSCSKRTCTKVPMSDKSTNTDPTHIYSISNVHGHTSMENTICIDEISSIRNVSIEKNISNTEENKTSIKKKLPKDHNITLYTLQNSEQGIQSKWFESSFEIDHFTQEKPEILQQSTISLKDNSESKTPAKEFKHKTYQQKNKTHRTKASSILESSKEIINDQAIIADSITAVKINKSCKDTRDPTNVALPNATVALPKAYKTFPKPTGELPETKTVKPEATAVLPETKTLRMPDATGELSNSTRTFPKATEVPEIVTLAMPENNTKISNNAKIPKANRLLPETKTVAMPEATMALPELNHSHSHIHNLFKNYKKIYSSKKNTNISLMNLNTAQNDINNNSCHKKLLATPKDLSVVLNDGIDIKNIDRKEILHQTTKSSTKIPKKSKYIRTNLQKTPTNGFSTKSEGLSVKNQDPSAKSKKLSTTPQDLSAKNMNFPIKSQDLSAKSKTLSNKYNDFDKSRRSEQGLKSLKHGKENIEGQKSSSSILNDSKAVSKETDLVRKTKDKHAIPNISQEDLVNSLFKDLVASQRIKPTDSWTVKTDSCHQCGLVSEGHMCAHTIREILERC